MVELIEFWQFRLGVANDLAALFLAHGAEGDLHILDAAYSQQRHACIAFHLIFHRAAGNGQGHGKSDQARGADLQVFDHAEFDDVASQFRVGYFT